MAPALMRAPPEAAMANAGRRRYLSHAKHRREARPMLDFTEEHQVAQKAIRAWCTAHLAPKVPQLETGDAPPYPLMRELCATFGIPDMIRASFAKMQAPRTEPDRA